MTRKARRVAWAAAFAVIAGLSVAVIILAVGRGRQGPGPLAGEAVDSFSVQVFDTDRPFGASRVSPARFAWPVRPFNRPHPLRATFGEPRGILDAGVAARGAVRAHALAQADQLLPIGRRILHTGVDVVAADGTAVYAVESGIARTGGRGYDRYVIVGSFGYWHLSGAVPSGTRVRAFDTVIGRVYPGQGHVHMTHFDLTGAAPVNPLIAGGLTPYADTAGPVIGELAAYDPSGLRVPVSSLRGAVALAVRAADVQSLGGARTGLYTLRYRIDGPGGVSVVGPVEVVRFDALPSTQTGDVIYTLASTRHRFQADFWYRITDRSPSADGFLHLERYRPGAYRLLVIAGDARGNLARKQFAVRVTPGP